MMQVAVMRWMWMKRYMAMLWLCLLCWHGCIW
jgi:hypothetical protein